MLPWGLIFSTTLARRHVWSPQYSRAAVFGRPGGNGVPGLNAGHLGEGHTLFQLAGGASTPACARKKKRSVSLVSVATRGTRGRPRTETANSSGPASTSVWSNTARRAGCAPAARKVHIEALGTTEARRRVVLGPPSRVPPSSGSSTVVVTPSRLRSPLRARARLRPAPPRS